MDIDRAISRRQSFLQPPHRGAFRLLDGFREGSLPVVLEVYGETLLAFDHRRPPDDAPADVEAIMLAVRERLPFLKAGILKQKRAEDAALRRGRVVFGEPNLVARRIEELGVRYALDLLSHHDSTFFLDTRELRQLLLRESKGKRVLNAFAYSGSLGVAAAAGGAAHVLQTDKSKGLLNLAKDSYSLNGFPVRRADFVTGDFFEVAARFRKANETFDTVIIDPPFFSDGNAGRVDLVGGVRALLDKARPLVADGGLLVVVVNALFVSGQELMTELEAIIAEGYAAFERRVDVPVDCAPPLEGGATLPADPAPFNHPTKIALLRLSRRDAKPAVRG